MTSKPKTPKALSKSNSPVSKTGQGETLKKRLVKAKEAELLKGREKILLAARACFAKQGFAGTSMRDIQIACGFSRGNLYHHFKTKEEIVQLIIQENLGRFCQRIEAILRELADKDLSLFEMIEDLARFAEEITKGPGKGMAFHVWSLAMVDVQIRNQMVLCFENIRQALEQKIRVLQKQGSIAKTSSAQNMSVMLFGLVIPAFTLQSVFMDKKALSASQYSKSLKSLFQSGS